jgi:hypothetical protein
MAKVEIVKKTVRGKGSSDVATLQAMFPETPSLTSAKQQYTDAKVTELTSAVMNDVQNGNEEFPNFDPNYGKSPDLTTVEKAEDGTLIWNHYSPPPSSPGPGLAWGVDAAKAQQVPSTVPTSSGMGSTKSPNVTAKSISQQFPGSLSSGKSGASP